MSQSHFARRVAAGKVNPSAGTNAATDDQIDEVLERINVVLQEKFGGGTARAMLDGLEQFEDNLVSMTDGSQLLALNSSGQPAAQIGAGSSSNGQPAAMDENAALAVLMSSTQVDTGIKIALRRMLDPTHPDPLVVDGRGTPQDITDANTERDAMKAERDTMKAERDTARQELADERNDRKDGSLAKRLADATAAGGMTAPEKAALKQLIEVKVRDRSNALTTGRMSTDINGHDELDEGIEEVLDKFS